MTDFTIIDDGLRNKFVDMRVYRAVNVTTDHRSLRDAADVRLPYEGLIRPELGIRGRETILVFAESPKGSPEDAENAPGC
ncbi:hypothetical protein EVAR_8092_1 [Eumeta japonica]|uniref:Uncharacterized protein n=1 Tax=Eumeta variegata TaxID=151549 RepID=A0A4C1TSN4_EUMVA|nr:hypothetical protein EVAR_8092_1 [Eumeta japonica]